MPAYAVPSHSPAPRVRVSIVVGSLIPTVTGDATASAQNAAVTVTASNATASAPGVTANAGNAAVTVTASNARGDVAASPAVALVTVTATQPNAHGPQSFATAVSSNGRYLVDQNGDPYFIQGASPQALCVVLSTGDMETYIADQAGRGINSMQVHLMLNDRFPADNTTSTSHNFYGDAPFSTMSTFSTPVEAYWTVVDTMFDLCETYGITVWASPAEHISYGPTIANLTDGQAVAFGEFIGARYRDRPNIIWSFGNDWQSGEWFGVEAKCRKIIEGLQNATGQDTHLITVWLDYTDSYSIEISTRGGYTAWNSLIDINLCYSYTLPYYQIEQAYADTTGSVTRPTFFGEGNYDNEHLHPEFGESDTTLLTLRRTAWWPVTWGGCGQFFGQFPIEFFNTGWEAELDSAAAQQNALVASILTGFDRWQDLEPDTGHAFVTAGYGTHNTAEDTDPLDNSFVTAAITADGMFAAVYIPDWATTGTLTIDVAGQINGSATITRVDPTDGSSTSDSAPFSSPGNNAGGDPDWLLFFEGTPTDATADAGNAAVTVTASNARGDVAASAVAALVTVTASNARADVVAHPAVASVAVTASNPTISNTANPAVALVTVTATNPVATGTATASAGNALVTVTANDASASGAAPGTANAAVALVTVTASNPGISNQVTAAAATVTVTASNARGDVQANAGNALVTVTASNAAGTGNTPGTANAQAALVTVTATNPAVSGSSSGTATAQVALVTVTATNVATANPQPAQVAISASNAVGHGNATASAVAATVTVVAVGVLIVRAGSEGRTTSSRDPRPTRTRDSGITRSRLT